MATMVMRVDVGNAGNGGSYYVRMPKGAKIIHIGLLAGQPRMWVVVDPDAEIEERIFLLLRENTRVEESTTFWHYIGAFCPPQSEWTAAWYVFEERKPKGA